VEHETVHGSQLLQEESWQSSAQQSTALQASVSVVAPQVEPRGSVSGRDRIWHVWLWVPPALQLTVQLLKSCHMSSAHAVGRTMIECTSDRSGAYTIPLNAAAVTARVRIWVTWPQVGDSDDRPLRAQSTHSTGQSTSRLPAAAPPLAARDTSRVLLRVPVLQQESQAP
jgi:hypothetical protein